MITLALTKGRILKETLPLLESAGIVPDEDITQSRRLQFGTNDPSIRLLVLRGSDAITYIRMGVADIGVVGKDMLLEDGGDELYEMLDLGIARCRLMSATIKGRESVDGSRIRVASKYVNVARAFYAEKGIQADVIKLYGGMELAPIMGLADEIVDIVDSGRTLEANGLEPKELIGDISSRLVANKAARKVKHAAISQLVAGIEKSL